jgi:hypothetical protein
MGWKKNEHFLFQEDEPIIFKGNIFNKMTFGVHLTVEIEISAGKETSKTF